MHFEHVTFAFHNMVCMELHFAISTSADHLFVIDLFAMKQYKQQVFCKNGYACR
jgi:hypothetical protein